MHNKCKIAWKASFACYAARYCGVHDAGGLIVLPMGENNIGSAKEFRIKRVFQRLEYYLVSNFMPKT